MRPDSGRKSRQRQRARRVCRRARRQRRGHEDQRRDAADEHAGPDQQAELLEAGEIDDQQPQKRRRRRPHPEHHARRGRRNAANGGVGVAGFLERKPVGDIQQDDAVHAESKQHRRRARRRRPRAWRRRNPSTPSTIRNDNADGSGADRDQPEAAKHDQQQRQDQRQRSDAVDDAFAFDDGFGFEADAVSAGKLHIRAADASSSGRCARPPRVRARSPRSRSNSACENAVSYGGFAGRAITSRRRPSAVT